MIKVKKKYTKYSILSYIIMFGSLIPLIVAAVTQTGYIYGNLGIGLLSLGFGMGGIFIFVFQFLEWLNWKSEIKKHRNKLKENKSKSIFRIKLEESRELFKKGVITEKEYLKRKKSILEQYNWNKPR